MTNNSIKQIKEIGNLSNGKPAEQWKYYYRNGKLEDNNLPTKNIVHLSDSSNYENVSNKYI